MLGEIMREKLSSKKTIKSNIFQNTIRVSSSNIYALLCGLITSFLIPLVVSVEDYGYWQLFSLYGTYAGFFALGFNDGIYLNYAGKEYNDEFITKFRTLKRVPIVLAVTGLITTLLLGRLFFDGNERFVISAVACYVPAVCINGFTAYVNQGTFRFKQYSRGIMLEKSMLVLFVLVLAGCAVSDFRIFVFASVLSSYCKVLYNLIADKEIMLTKGESISLYRNEIVCNFRQGFIIMIAALLSGSIIISSKLIVNGCFGITVFSGYAFAFSTLSIAIQCIQAVSQVMYPFMKKKEEQLGVFLSKAGRVLSIAGSVVLLSYYLVHILIVVLYSKYDPILSYLFYLYPLVIFQSKYSSLIYNVCLVKKNVLMLLLVNSAGLVAVALSSYIVASITGDAGLVVLSVVVVYSSWYYASLCIMKAKNGYRVNAVDFSDIPIIIMFIICNIIFQISTIVSIGDLYRLVLPCAVMILFNIIILFVSKRKICEDIKFFKTV